MLAMEQASLLHPWSLGEWFRIIRSSRSRSCRSSSSLRASRTAWSYRPCASVTFRSSAFQLSRFCAAAALACAAAALARSRSCSRRSVSVRRSGAPPSF